MSYRFTKLALLGCLAAATVFAQAARPGAAPGRPLAQGALRQRILRNLDLTAGQKAQAKTILQQAKTAAAPVRTQLQQTRKALETAIKTDPNQIASLSAQAGQSQGQLLAIRGQAMAQIYALLTPDQKTKLDQVEQRRRQRMQQRRPGGQAGGSVGD